MHDKHSRTIAAPASEANDWVNFPQIAACLPACANWTEKQFLNLGRKHTSSLKFCRRAGGRSEAIWPRRSLLEWSIRVWKNAPELAQEFERKLNALPANNFGSTN